MEEDMRWEVTAEETGEGKHLFFPTRMEASKRGGKWRGEGNIFKEVMIKFIESWNNVISDIITMTCS
jgi:hypothetical protein